MVYWIASFSMTLTISILCCSALYLE